MPFVAIIGHALVWAGFLVLGIQIILLIEVNLVYPMNLLKGIENEVVELNSTVYFANNTNYDNTSEPQFFGTALNQIAFSNNTNYVNNSEPKFFKTALIQFAFYLIQLNAVKIDDWLKNLNFLANPMAEQNYIDHLTLFYDVINIFNFSPEVSLGYFWESGAGFIAILTFLAMFVLPVIKSLIWIWYYFTPSDEWIRGWILTVNDFSGKWMVSYVFVMTILAVGLTFQREIVFPSVIFGDILPRDCALTISIGARMSWTGLGATLLIICCLLSLIIGQAILWMHQSAVEWEKRRRKRLSLSDQILPTTHSAATVSTENSTPTEDQRSPFAEIDSPLVLNNRFQQGASVRLEGAGQIDIRMMQAIDSYSSTHNSESTGDSNPYVHTQFQVRKPILNVLARFGSSAAFSLSGESQVESNRRFKMVHPFVEAMCDRVHQPIRGVRLRWTPFGKAIIWFFLFLLSAWFIAAQLIPLFEIEITGLIKLIVLPKDDVKTYSVFTVSWDVSDHHRLNRFIHTDGRIQIDSESIRLGSFTIPYSIISIYYSQFYANDQVTGRSLSLGLAHDD